MLFFHAEIEEIADIIPAVSAISAWDY